MISIYIYSFLSLYISLHLYIFTFIYLHRYHIYQYIFLSIYLYTQKKQIFWYPYLLVLPKDISIVLPILSINIFSGALMPGRGLVIVHNYWMDQKSMNLDHNFYVLLVNNVVQKMRTRVVTNTISLYKLNNVIFYFLFVLS